jgi:hypothetical protein
LKTKSTALARISKITRLVAMTVLQLVVSSGAARLTDYEAAKGGFYGAEINKVKVVAIKLALRIVLIL